MVRAVVTSVSTVTSCSVVTPGLFDGADLDDLRTRVNHRDQLTDPHRRAGVPVGLLPIVVSVAGVQHPRDHGVHPSALISNCISCFLLMAGWPG